MLYVHFAHTLQIDENVLEKFPDFAFFISTLHFELILSSYEIFFQYRSLEYTPLLQYILNKWVVVWSEQSVCLSVSIKQDRNSTNM